MIFFSIKIVQKQIDLTSSRRKRILAKISYYQTKLNTIKSILQNMRFINSGKISKLYEVTETMLAFKKSKSRTINELNFIKQINKHTPNPIPQ